MTIIKCESLIIFQLLPLSLGMYDVYVADWLEVFPQNQLYFVKIEEFKNKKTEILEDIFHFLQLGKHAEILWYLGPSRLAPYLKPFLDYQPNLLKTVSLILSVSCQIFKANDPKPVLS